MTVNDYAVLVSGLPADATADEVRDHFNALYALDEPDWEHGGYCCGTIRRKTSRYLQYQQYLSYIHVNILADFLAYSLTYSLSGFRVMS